MGLDISHIKATLERPKITDPNELEGMTEETFEGFDVSFSHFEKYIQNIDCPNILKTAIIVKEEIDLEYTIDWFKNYNYEIFFEKSDISLKNRLKEYESKNNLNQLFKHFSKVPQKWILLEYYEIIKKIGFYQFEEGYQRKGMNPDFKYFYEDENKINFVLYEDFERAYKCVDSYQEEKTNRKTNFKENFLDKYEFGASYLSLSY